MNLKNENKLDQFFKDGLADSENHISFREEDWTAMEKLLGDKSNRKGAVIWLYRVATGIAAALLMFLGWQFLKTPHSSNKVNQQTKIKTTLPHKDSGNILRTPANNNYASTPNHNKTGNASQNKLTTGGQNIFSPNSSNNTAWQKPVRSNSHFASAPSLIKDSTKNEENFIASASSVQNKKEPTANRDLLSGQSLNISVDTPGVLPVYAATIVDTGSIHKPGNKSDKAIKTALPTGPRFTLAVLTAPDINGVGSLSGGKLGTNASISLFVKLSNRLTISTGAAYAVKPYGYNIGTQTSGGGYYNYGQTTTSNINIYANCKVVDIPLNINYTVYSKGRNAFTAGTGLSSYFMLHEYYQFNYQNSPSRSINISNQNRHPFGVVNLNASYMRQVSPGLNLIVQPYYKLPITHIGYEKINLQSGGVAIGVGWNFKHF